MGEPSPSLARINKMTAGELTIKIESLQGEQAPLEAKLARLERHIGAINIEKMKKIRTQLERLKALEQICRDRLRDKEARATMT
jgi:hypothetical protein